MQNEVPRSHQEDRMHLPGSQGVPKWTVASTVVRCFISERLSGALVGVEGFAGRYASRPRNAGLGPAGKA